MINLPSFVRAFGAGAIGGAANVLPLVLIWQFVLGPGYSHEFLYRQMTWGGIWGLAFLLPLMASNWMLRGAVWGAAATAAALFYFAVVPVSATNILIGLVVNSGAWGLTASWLYQHTGASSAAAPQAAPTGEPEVGL